jgi:hypothetical protein
MTASQLPPKLSLFAESNYVGGACQVAILIRKVLEMHAVVLDAVREFVLPSLIHEFEMISAIDQREVSSDNSCQ